MNAPNLNAHSEEHGAMRARLDQMDRAINSLSQRMWAALIGILLIVVKWASDNVEIGTKAVDTAQAVIAWVGG